MTGLSVRSVSKSFGGRPVLDRIDLEAPDGITAVLGPSGCGKTTLLRVIAGFLQPDGGSIVLGEREVVGGHRPVPVRERGVGYVPQEGALFPHLSAAGNVAFGLPRAERRSARLSRRVEEVLELVELDPALHRRFPHELSGGQQQRVALARALAPHPALVLLDEPFSSLDAGLREDTGRAVVRALRASGATGVIVTHDQGEALSSADRVAVMSAGRFLQVAAPAELYLAPASATVARLRRPRASSSRARPPDGGPPARSARCRSQTALPKARSCWRSARTDRGVVAGRRRRGDGDRGQLLRTRRDAPRPSRRRQPGHRARPGRFVAVPWRPRVPRVVDPVIAFTPGDPR